MANQTKRVPSDFEIAHSVRLKPIVQIAAELGIRENDLELYGRYKAKVALHLIDPERVKKSNLLLVTAITPTVAGEGKTTISIALADALNALGKKTTVVLREPSLGPVFGVKGGATGGGYAQVAPMEDINLHFTGDFSAIEKANNLLAALIDNNIQNRKESLDIDPRTVTWKRVMDVNDRALRHLITGLGGTAGGVPREAAFDITAASEVMAILCLAENLTDLKNRLAEIYVGDNFDRRPIFARDLKSHGAMAALLKDAIKPNLVQTLAGNSAIVHGGPFGNIAQGTNSVIGTKMGLSFSDYVVTEAGFGAELGAEKFIDIKCESAGLSPRSVVLVATVRALRYQGGQKKEHLLEPNLPALERGVVNLEKHLAITRCFGLPTVVAINHFMTDTEEELSFLEQRCRDLRVRVARCRGWELGAEGAMELAQQVVESAASYRSRYTPVYHWDASVKSKIEAVAKKIYGAGSVVLLEKAEAALEKVRRLGLERLPICIAKTQSSLSDDNRLLGRPEGFTLVVRDIEIASGAGFLIPVTGTILRMPGLPARPAAENFDIDDRGNITGFF